MGLEAPGTRRILLLAVRHRSVVVECPVLSGRPRYSWSGSKNPQRHRVEGRCHARHDSRRRPPGLGVLPVADRDGRDTATGAVGGVAHGLRYAALAVQPFRIQSAAGRPVCLGRRVGRRCQWRPDHAVTPVGVLGWSGHAHAARDDCAHGRDRVLDCAPAA